jgi:hypothetical protein
MVEFASNFHANTKILNTKYQIILKVSSILVNRVNADYPSVFEVLFILAL